jgi:hypothetical protein
VAYMVPIIVNGLTIIGGKIMFTPRIQGRKSSKIRGLCTRFFSTGVISFDDDFQTRRHEVQLKMLPVTCTESPSVAEGRISDSKQSRQKCTNS